MGELQSNRTRLLLFLLITVAWRSGGSARSASFSRPLRSRPRLRFRARWNPSGILSEAVWQPKSESDKYHGLDSAALVAAYRNIYLSRRVDDKEIQLKRQNKIYFQINSAGPRGGHDGRRHGAEARRTTGSTATTGTAPSVSSSA